MNQEEKKKYKKIIQLLKNNPEQLPDNFVNDLNKIIKEIDDGSND